jgi:pSer/pThr/pTyr-binding forkhead associated (FHA) protein
VSKLHAHVREIGGAMHIVDTGSQNGTFLDGKQLVAHIPMPIRIGSRVRFGSVGALLANAATVYDLVAAMINEQP